MQWLNTFDLILKNLFFFLFRLYSFYSLEDVTITGEGLYLALMANELWGFVSVPHLL